MDVTDRLFKIKAENNAAIVKEARTMKLNPGNTLHITKRLGF
jgi:hypothetical protein